MKRCPRCEQDKPIDAFGRDSSKFCGRMSHCRDCCNAARRERYNAKLEHEQGRSRAYYQANREQVLARMAATEVANPGRHAENQRNWAAANPERSRESRRQSALRHRGMVLEQLWEAQAGLCYLCEEPLPPVGSRSLHIDHDHACCRAGRSCPACRRGLTHNGCNTAIGLLGESPAKLRRIADNLALAQARMAA